MAGGLLVGDGGHVDDADVGVGHFGCGLQEREKKLDEQGVAHLVRGELDLVSVHTRRRRRGHDAGVEHQDVEAVCLGDERTGAFLH